MKLPDTEDALVKLIVDANAKLRAVRDEAAKVVREEDAAVLKSAKAGQFAVVVKPFGDYLRITRPGGRTIGKVINNDVNVGSVFKVYAVQPRKGIIWLIAEDKRIFEVPRCNLIRTYKDELTAAVAAVRLVPLKVVKNA